MSLNTRSLNATNQRKVILITGPSSGIGAAAAVRLASNGHRVFVGARRTVSPRQYRTTSAAAEGRRLT
jgi:NADP-dependent 3-hydroxy acid dehydrogenase YdfG